VPGAGFSVCAAMLLDNDEQHLQCKYAKTVILYHGGHKHTAVLTVQ